MISKEDAPKESRKANYCVIMDGEPYKIYVDEENMEVKSIETFGLNDDPKDFKKILRSLFLNKDGTDYPLPRCLDPSFLKFGFYRSKI